MTYFKCSGLSRGSPTGPSPAAAARPSKLLVALALAGGVALLAREVEHGAPSSLDEWARDLTDPLRARRIDRLLAPLYPIGLPGGYITAAYLTARWLRRRRAAGGPAIVTSAWAGWLVHRAAKLVYHRERPRRDGRARRTDSYPSGHTTGATSLALTTAYVLSRRGVVSPAAAAALTVGAAAAMGAYRVIADDHWATDVVGGWLLGGAIGLVCCHTLADVPGRGVRAAGSSPKAARPRVRRASPSSRA